MEISRFQDFLGRLIERNPSFFIRLGRFETRWLEDYISEIEVDRPIYISGLARSGSTIILEFLASHQYRDFPLVHIPFWWNWFLDRASSGNQIPIERAHKDRIKVLPESPEAMEEIIWMAFFPSSHDQTKNNVIDSQDINPDFEMFYQNHIRKVLFVRNGSRYLAKGNYNISRLGYINSIFPEARLIIPVRDPVSHIGSLMRQHKLFCDAESSDPKVLAYMQRVGHFEFGLDIRPINFDCYDTVQRIDKLWRSGQSIRGWAAYWASAYDYVADLIANDEILSNKTLIVYYNDLCAQPSTMLKSIYSHCELDVDDDVLQKQASCISAPTYYTSKLSQVDIDIIKDETIKTVERIHKLIST